MDTTKLHSAPREQIASFFVVASDFLDTLPVAPSCDDLWGRLVDLPFLLVSFLLGVFFLFLPFLFVSFDDCLGEIFLFEWVFDCLWMPWCLFLFSLAALGVGLMLLFGCVAMLIVG